MKITTCILFAYFTVMRLYAQDILPADTISMARSLAYNKDFAAADRLLSAYNANNSNIDALTLHAQLLYWMKAFDRSVAVYDKAMHINPQPSSLQLDYARVLFNINKLTKARHLLKAYRQFDSSNAEAEIMTTYIELWRGRIGSAKKKAGLLLQKYPGNAEAKDIITTAKNYTVAYIKSGTSIFTDDQPLKGHMFYAEAGVYKSWLFAPTARAEMYRFNAADSAFTSSFLELSNTFQLGTMNKIKVHGGVFEQNSNELNVTGGIEMSQKLPHHFSIQAGLERRPYQYAVSSLKTVVLEDKSSLSVSYNRNDKWLGQAGYELFNYKDANKIHTAYLWILAPVVTGPHFSLSGGYAFRYADAVKNNFVSKIPVSELVASPPYEGVPGIYHPYFTPENQMVHAALGSVKIIPLKKLELSSRISVGVLAKADNPYLWLQKTGNHYDIQKGYVNTDFMPVSWVNELRIAASDKFFISALYNYDQLLYYKTQRGSIELKYLFK